MTEHAPDSLPTLVVSGDDTFHGREWLVTNGLGGHASGSLLGAPTRRYHGLFVPNLSEPRGRHVLVSRLDDAVSMRQSPVKLTDHLREFRLDGTIPVWRFEHDGVVIERSIVMPWGHNATCVRWRQLDGPPCRLVVRPYVAARRQDAELQPEARPPFTLAPADGRAGIALILDGGVRLRLHVLQMLQSPDGFDATPRTDHDVTFEVERARGYADREHQHSPGEWTCELAPGQDVAFVAHLDGEALPGAPDALFEAERTRLAGLLRQSGVTGADVVESRLVLAADAFIVQPGSRGEESDAGAGRPDPDFRSVMAGYHWFNDWGRDTMISLEGLTLSTGRHAEAQSILRTFAGYVQDGLIPNLFPEGGREGLYHTVDATLWFFHALARYTERTGDRTLVAELYPTLRDIVDHHLRGTRFGIGVDPTDGLLRASAEGYQLTWMDAKMDGWVVTPRRGKPVEIQALWFNALRLMSGWAKALGHSDEDFDILAERVRVAFDRRFWSAALGHLLDVVDGPEGDDPSLRPNQVFAMSLDHPVLDRSHHAAVLDAVRRELLTPAGLRTLAPREPAYQPVYQGDLRTRDGAYHQGTVWPWLLGHFVDAWWRTHGDAAQARAFLGDVPRHLLEAGVGHVSEVFDAESPHLPGGCIAQAWSAAELLRAWQLTKERTHG